MREKTRYAIIESADKKGLYFLSPSGLGGFIESIALGTREDIIDLAKKLEETINL